MRVLAIDYGERRIGLAISDSSRTLARPLLTLTRSDESSAVTRLISTISGLRGEADGLSTILIGLPRRLDGSPNEETGRVLAFADRLRHHIDLPIVFQDERLSSVEAETRLARSERDWRKRKVRLDAAAAAVILQDYLDETTAERGR